MPNNPKLYARYTTVRFKQILYEWYRDEILRVKIRNVHGTKGI